MLGLNQTIFRKLSSTLLKKYIKKIKNCCFVVVGDGGGGLFYGPIRRLAAK